MALLGWWPNEVGTSPEGAGWVEDVGEYLGPRTRELLVDAQDGLARSNGPVGRWATSWRTRPR